MKTKIRPFKFLDPYGKDDFDIFFGREEEEKKLYSLVKRSKIVLIYGPSGSGKTSIIQCGLYRQFDISEWIPLYIRRGEDIMFSLYTELNTRAQVTNQQFEAAEIELKHVKYLLEEIRKKDLRPVYLFFDQFEELLILGSEDEKKRFKEFLGVILERSAYLSCKIIILLREEYFAWLDEFEEEVPYISENRLRIEPMRLEDVKRVIINSSDPFNYSLENPEENARQIIEAVAGKKPIFLPYLQVYLDHLRKMQYKRMYPDGHDASDLSKIDFTTNSIKDVGEIEDVLQQFLKDQKEEIQTLLDEKTLGNNAFKDCVAMILDNFVTQEKTKLPVSYSSIGNLYRLSRSSPEYLINLPPDILRFVIDKLLTKRILRNDGSSFELAHDTLAKLIGDERNLEANIRRNIPRYLKNAYDKYPATNELLSYKEVQTYEEYIKTPGLDPRLVEFYKKSKEYREKEAEKELRRKRRYWGLIVFVLYLFGISIVALIGANKYKEAAISNYALVYTAYAIDTIKNRNDALLLANYIYNLDKYDNDTKVKLEKKLMELALDPAIQTQLGIYTYPRSSSKGMSREDMDISANGDYVVLRYDSADNKMRNSLLLFNKSGRLVNIFDNAYYAYFLNHSDTLVITGFIKGKQEYFGWKATWLQLYDCRNKRFVFKHTLLAKDGKLYPPDFIFPKKEKSNNPFRIKYLANGNLSIPYLKYNNDYTVNGFTRTVNDPEYVDRPSPLFINAHGEEVIFKLLDGRWQIPPTLNTPIMEMLKKYMGQYVSHYIDLSENGSLMYGRNGRFFVSRDGKNILDSVRLPEQTTEIYSDDNTFLITTTKDSLFLAHAKNFNDFRFINEKFVAADFKKGIFITHSNNQNTNDTLNIRNIKGDIISSFSYHSKIESAVYNNSTGDILVLTQPSQKQDSRLLYLIDNHCQIKTMFGLTSNDTYGFSKNGQTFYFVRDNIFCLLKNDSTLVNLTDFKAIQKWLNANDKYNYTPTTDMQNHYNLHFPGPLAIFE